MLVTWQANIDKAPGGWRAVLPSILDMEVNLGAVPGIDQRQTPASQSWLDAFLIDINFNYRAWGNELCRYTSPTTGQLIDTCPESMYRAAAACTLPGQATDCSDLEDSSFGVFQFGSTVPGSKTADWSKSKYYVWTNLTTGVDGSTVSPPGGPGFDPPC